MHKTGLIFTAILLVAPCFLGGCAATHYDFKAPETDQGRFCVTQCAAIRETCNGNEILRANAEKAGCERSNDVVFVACAGKSTSKDQEKECEKHRNYCRSNPDTESCDGEYRTCFVNCGGSIREYTE
jgi:hypothetical protein